MLAHLWPGQQVLATVSRVMSAYHHKVRTTSNKSNCWRKRKLSERDVRVLTQTVSKKHKTTVAQLTAELNVHLGSPVSTKCFHWELHRANVHRRAVIAKLSVMPNVGFGGASSTNLGQCETWIVLWWVHLHFPTSGRVTLWRSAKEAYNSDGCVPRVKHGGGSVEVWAAMSCHC